MCMRFVSFVFRGFRGFRGFCFVFFRVVLVFIFVVGFVAVFSSFFFRLVLTIEFLDPPRSGNGTY